MQQGKAVSLEEVYAVQPDVILLSTGGPYDTLTQGEWAGLTAVQNGRYYEIPGLPYDWMSSPPSVNRVEALTYTAAASTWSRKCWALK